MVLYKLLIILCQLLFVDGFGVRSVFSKTKNDGQKYINRFFGQSQLTVIATSQQEYIMLLCFCCHRDSNNLIYHQLEII